MVRTFPELLSRRNESRQNVIDMAANRESYRETLHYAYRVLQEAREDFNQLSRSENETIYRAKLTRLKLLKEQAFMYWEGVLRFQRLVTRNAIDEYIFETRLSSVSIFQYQLLNISKILIFPLFS